MLKATNPKDACGTAKVPMFSVVPWRVIGQLALALFEGARKYGRHNYRTVGVRASVYADATARHMSAWWEGQDIDPDSRLCHIDKAIASLVVLRDSMLQGNWVDDRPPRAVDAEGWVSEQNNVAKQMIELYPNAAPAATALEDLRSKVKDDQITTMRRSRSISISREHLVHMTGEEIAAIFEDHREAVR